MTRDPDPVRAATRLAAAQHTIVTYQQLLECGLGRKAIAARRRTGELRVVFRGIYSFGCGVLPPLAIEHAALLACGERAFLSHRTAAAMWGLLPHPSEPEVSVLTGERWPRGGLHLHRITRIDRGELRRREGLLLSSPARTLLELAAALEQAELERAFDETFGRRLVRKAEVEAQLGRHAGSRGAARLRALLMEAAMEGFLRSRGERAFRALLRKAGLSDPEANVAIGRYVVDFVWRRERLIVEFDSWNFHRGRERFESDRERDAALKAAGWEVIRFTWRQVLYEPELVLFRLGQIMALVSLRARAG
ncbi:MAG TPA: type IV toxin-antitoxin system AbiEi family antitoxin domain-containing protein [Solirubrobacteraceae bacterium]|nr:type IV toxin-antitoxin system AbiEi family antitoxin domain-containing protein [Solirubrobacteraceae bacterium]